MVEETDFYLSKSRVNTYLECPYRYKLCYVDGYKGQATPAMKTGIEVHDFIDNVYKKVTINGSNIIIPEIKEEKNEDYINNVISFVKDRWQVCVNNSSSPEKYFFPVYSEKKFEIENPKVVGIVDAVFLNFNNEHVILENKTGKPNELKVKNYRDNDLIWYKMILQESEGINAKYGSIYFPYDNSVYNFVLKDEEVVELRKQIKTVKQKIINKEFIPTPSRERCGWCTYKKYCKFKWKG